MDLQAAKNIYKPRDPEGHKGTFGKAIICAGRTGMMGSAVLCTRACLKSGVGMSYLVAPANGMPIAQMAVPEAICLLAPDDINQYDAVGLGPGMGRDANAASKVEYVLVNTKRPIVIDADAINLIVDNWWQVRIPCKAILTPHSVEFSRLSGTRALSREEEIAKAVEFARQRQCIIVLKGHRTAVIDSDGTVDINTTGNSGMATAGSGDVLTGIITGLLAQGYEPYDAARLGVFLHGLAGDIAAAELTEESVMASDIVNAIPKAYKKIIFG